MTTAFWLIAAVLMALVILLLSWPLLRRRSGAAGASNRAINASIYRDQLAELVREKDSGALPEAEYRAAHAELERRLIEDIRDTADVRSATIGGTRAVRTIAALLLVIPLASISLYLWLGEPEALVAVSSGQPASHEAGSMGDMNQLAAKLADKLEKNPDNPQGWIMLGRTYKAMGRYDEAERAYLRAGDTANAQPDLILERVELAADRNNGRIEGAALKMLAEVLDKDPANPQATFLAGYGAFGRQDYRTAIDYWQRLLQRVPPDSQDAHNLQAGIAEAQTRLGIKGPPAAKAPPATAATDNIAVIRGKVSLAPALADKAAPGDSVFIFARAPQGPPMPLAVIRSTVSELPMEFTLDDSKAMSPQAKLSLFKTVRIEARVAKSGNPLAQPGDLSGSIESVKVGTTGLALTIDHVLP